MTNHLQTIMAEVEAVLNHVEQTEIERVAGILKDSKRIFVAGEGRSGLMAKSFAMRLMHLGAEVFAVGETITPSIKQEDTLIVVSGSGKTKNVRWTAEKAKELGCLVIAFTSNLESELAAAASSNIHIPAATKYRKEGEMESIQPLGSLFDQCMHIVFDSICLCFAELKKVEHSSAFNLHSNLE